ncbi:MAG: GNAT family N-acetyltransferase [Candidatus Promineifilaceae bacterium]|jgi:acetyltransferase
MNNDIEHKFYSNEGQLISVRPMTAEDAPLLVNLFEHMGPNSRYLRFNLALTDPDPELVWEEARRMADVDADKDGAWLAFTDLPGQRDAPIAAVRYARLDPVTAEAALAVRDDMQNKGIGSGLLLFLVDRAQDAGILRFVATIQRANQALLHILNESPLKVSYESEGSIITIVAEITDPTPIS